jgi:predicted GNAT family acetyltransferase
MNQQSQPPGEVTNNEAESRYELRMDGRVAAMAQYTLDGDKVRFTHTEVESEHEGQGLGSKLAAHALDDVRRRGLKAVPQCKFIASYIARHEQEYGDLVDRS